LVKVPSDSEREDVNLTTGGFVGGTPNYIAPEQAAGDAVDGRADIYSLGCVAYWLLTGRQVFESGSAAGVIAAHMRAAPIPPSQRAQREIPPDLERVILKCLQKKPDDRPQSAEDLSHMLGSCETEAVWTRQMAKDWWERNGSRSSTGTVTARSDQIGNGI
jgi:serine/threonine-protein kinase